MGNDRLQANPLLGTFRFWIRLGDAFAARSEP